MGKFGKVNPALPNEFGKMNHILSDVAISI